MENEGLIANADNSEANDLASIETQRTQQAPIQPIEPLQQQQSAPTNIESNPIVQNIILEPVNQAPTGINQNPSQGGVNGPLPSELTGWNWGAFLMSWIWAIGNKTYIGLLALLSPISLIVSIVLGVKGNEWAWKNRKFESRVNIKNVHLIR